MATCAHGTCRTAHEGTPANACANYSTAFVESCFGSRLLVPSSSSSPMGLWTLRLTAAALSRRLAPNCEEGCQRDKKPAQHSLLLSMGTDEACTCVLVFQPRRRLRVGVTCRQRGWGDGNGQATNCRQLGETPKAVHVRWALAMEGACHPYFAERSNQCGNTHRYAPSQL